MEISEIKIFKMDIAGAIIESIEPTEYEDDFKIYLIELLSIITAGSGRNFRFDRNTTEVRAQISRLSNNEDFGVIATEITNRLLVCEQTIQTRMEKMEVKIHKGIVVQALISDNNTTKFIICKADHNEFIDEDNFKLKRGYPKKQKIFKAFVCSLLPDNAVENVLVYDTNSKMSVYWYKDFLELTKVYTDEDNTHNAFDTIDKGIIGKLKKEFPQDYMHLSNSNVHYFRATEEFDIEDYISNAIGDYVPFDNKLNIVDLKNKIRELPTTSKMPFDSKFSIVKSAVTKRFIKDIPLTEQIELHFKTDVPNLQTIVTAEEGDDGTKYVKIKSDRGYQYFNNLQQSN